MIKPHAADTADAFRSAFSDAPGAAFVITKVPETILVVTGESPSAPCFLLDSHPRPPHYTEAHLLRFCTVDALCRELAMRFPPLCLGSDLFAQSVQESMLSMWSSFSFALAPAASGAPELLASPPASCDSRSMSMLLSAPLLSRPPLSPPSRQTSRQRLELTQRERTNVSCPIMQVGELMADPVLAADGHVYERENIERHFEAERERLAAPQISGCDAARDDACCGAQRRREHFNSPIMGGPLQHTQLTPVHPIISMIETFIELRRVDPEEAREWRERRDAATAAARQREATGVPQLQQST